MTTLPLLTFLACAASSADRPLLFHANDAVQASVSVGGAPQHGIVSSPHPAGEGWRWLDSSGLEVLLVPTSTDIWTMGVDVRTPGPAGLLATWSAREWADEAGWVPLLPVRPDLAHRAQVTEDRLSLPVVDPGEHGCDSSAWPTSARQEDRLEIVIEGVPYLALPPEGLTLSIDRPLPWLQLQAHADFVEVDMDHSCEDAAWMAEGPPSVRLSFPLE